MVIPLELPPELVERLRSEARRQGTSEGDCARRILDRYLPPSGPKAHLIASLQTWAEAAKSPTPEDRAEGEALRRALDEDRLSDRPLYPTDLEGVTW